MGDAGGGIVGQSPSSSLLSSSVRRALKAPPITWGMGGGARARGDHRAQGEGSFAVGGMVC